MDDENSTGKFHEKFGLMYDTEGNIIAFSGSLNETENALCRNYEAIDIFTSWANDSQRVAEKERAFDTLWNNAEKGLKVLSASSINLEKIIRDNTRPPSSEETTLHLFNVHEALQRAFEKIQRAVDNKGKPTGIGSGFTHFDKVTSGFQNSDLILIAARPSMGKTAFALNIALNAALAKKSVAVFSLEMSNDQLGQRLSSIRSGIDSQKLSTGNLSEDEFVEVSNTVDELEGIAFFIDDTSSLTLKDLKKHSKMLKYEYNIELIIIDYIQLLQGSREFLGNRVQEMSEISNV